LLEFVWVRGANFVRIAALAIVLAVLAPASAGATVSRNFVGMIADGPVFASGVNLDNVLNKMVASGVGRLRVGFAWALAQPYRRWRDVPHDRLLRFVRGPGGVPTIYYQTDLIVAAAAKHHLSLLPVVTYAPPWDASRVGNHRQPASPAPYARYLTGLVERYGSKGSFWAAHPSIPKRPITAWQIWNEPDLTLNWSTTPFAASYLALLRAAHDAVKKADPSATVILGAMAHWQDLELIYAVPGSRKLFDSVAANSYTPKPEDVITILGRYRQTMDENGDTRKPLLATEIGWPSGLGRTSLSYSFQTTKRGQARKLAKVLPLLARSRRRLKLGAFYYYTWMSPDPEHANPFAFAGLLHYNQSTHSVHPKPAYWAFRRAVKKLESR
jgi:hypothetical protein